MLDWILLIPTLMLAVFAYFALKVAQGVQLLIALTIEYPFIAVVLIVAGSLAIYISSKPSSRRKS